ncbi:MAG: hypothetical protein WA765_12540 [Candidatus Acidiferrum sp.]
MVFIISYDLRKPDFDYQPLYDELDDLGAKRIQKSVWAVHSSDSTSDVFDALWPYMHNDRDRLFVAVLDRDSGYKAKNSLTRLKNV